MDLNMKEILRIMRLVARVHILGKMENNIKDNG